MSFEIMAWAVKQKTANSGQQLVLLLLANHTNGHTGQCNPSHRLLAEECRMGLSTLKNHIKGLEDAGFLKIVHISKEGVSLPNQYILGGVGQNLADGGSDIDRQVGQNLATKQEDKPVIKPSKRATRLSEDFVVPDEWKTWAKVNRPDLNINLVADTFVDYWISRADAGAAKTNWLATWRNWVRNSKAAFVKPISFAEQATNRALGRPVDQRLPTPEEQAERAKRIALR
jgi:hypothetical protein